METGQTYTGSHKDNGYGLWHRKEPIDTPLDIQYTYLHKSNYQQKDKP